jgi:hypothetical protein
MSRFLRSISAVTVLLLISAFVASGYDEALVRMALGGATLRDGTDTTIRMTSEVVTIELRERDYVIDARFTFYNDGPTVTELVGFPNHAWGYAFPPFKGAEAPGGIVTWVNGVRQELDEVPGSMEVMYRDGSSEYRTVTDPQEIERIRTNLRTKPESDVFLVEETRWFIKEVTFPSHESTNTRVLYTASYGNFEGGFYYYGSGASWKGEIGSALFTFRWSPQVWLSGVPRFEEDNPYSGDNCRDYTITRVSEFELSMSLEAFEPVVTELLRFGHGWGDSGAEPWAYYPSEFESGEWAIPADFLHILSLEKLYLLSKYIMAYRGKIFPEPELDAYFRDRYWYEPRPDYTDSDLTELDRQNLAEIQRYVSELKQLVGK